MKELQLFDFESKEVRVVFDEKNEPMFVGKDICGVLGYSNHNKAMNDHCKGITHSYPLSTKGGVQDFRVLYEPDVLRLIIRCGLPEADRFERKVFEEILPSIRKTGSYSTDLQQPAESMLITARYETEKELLVLKYAGEILNLSDVSKLGMLHKFMELKGMNKNILPVYVEKKRLSSSASKLLEDRDKPMSTIAFNQLMIANGFLEEKERKSTGNTIKKFKSITEAGLQFGENLASPKNDREVQPYYYEDSFDSLLKLILNQG